MKKILFLALALSLGLASCGNGGPTVTLGASARFSRAQLQAAADCVQVKFQEFEGCTLQKLWYDEDASDKAAESYLQYGRGADNGVARANVIVLFSDFRSPKEARLAGGFNPDEVYRGWSWILIRDSETGAWRVDDYGY